MMPPLIRAIADRGVSVWLDDLGRERLVSGSLQALIEHGGVTGVTTNPSIFAQAVERGSSDYAAALEEAATAGRTAEEAVFDLMIDDVTQACDLLARVHRRSEGRDGYVSLEVDPRLAHDTLRTIEQAQILWDRVARPNVMIKIPATPEGLPAITEVLARGINVNVTLIFSLERYSQVRAAHVAGLDAAHQRGKSLASIGSVASFFVSRLDTAVDSRLDEAAGGITGEPLRGATAVTNARAAYADYISHVTSASWAERSALGAMPQRPLWASTGTKDPTYSPFKYVTELVTPGAVNTVPAATLAALSDWNPPELDGDDADEAGPLSAAKAAAAVLIDPEPRQTDPRTALAAYGLDYDEIVHGLETAGVASFVSAWNTLLDDVAQAMAGRRV
jgi:transaldolase